MTTETTLYQQLAGEISGLIDRGTLRPGERIPSVRRLSEKKRVSVSTVLEAYRILEDRGLVEARPQSGYFVRARPRLLPEPELTRPPAAPSFVGVSRLIDEVLEAARSPRTVPLGAGCPGPELFPAAKLQRILASVSRRKARTLAHYSLAAGNDELRRELAKRSLDWGKALAPEEFVVTNGCMEALNLCLRAVAKPGDAIAIESPAYFGVLQIIESHGMKALEIPTHPREGISLDALSVALQTRRIKACVVVPTVNNPLGSIMPEANKKRLVELLAAAGVPLIEDDIYGDLTFAEPRPVTAKSFDKKGMVMLCSSFTKILAPGSRVGWVAPGRFQPRVEMEKFINSIATAEVLQMTIAEFMRNGGYDHHLRRLRRVFHDNLTAFTAAIERSFPEETRVTRPEGGFMLWVELPGKIDALELHREALRNHIGIAPGPLFSATGRYRNCFRMNCGHPWSRDIELAIWRLGELAKQMLVKS